MNTERVKFVRFDDWNSENSYSEQKPSNDDGFYPRVMRPTLSAVMDSIRRGYEMGSERIKSWKKPLSFRSHVMQSEKKSVSEKRILDPQGPFLQWWNKIFVLSCVIALSIDPLFFYMPVIDGKRKCLGLDKTLEITACVLRSFIDTFYILRIIFQFRTGFIARSSRVFGRGELVDDPKAIAKRYLMSYFIVDILAILPLPQLVVLIIVPAVKGPVPLVAKEMLKTIIFCQYVPRIARIYPLYNDVKRTSGILTETAWAGAALNLFLYMLASHIFGACWYLYSIERQDSCWRDVCRKLNDMSNCTTNLYCGEFHGSNNTLLHGSCPSLGQNLKTSTFVGEVFFAIFISISGLVLFALLIGNMQKYLESTTVRLEEMRVKRQDAEQWMSHRMLPENLRDRIRRYEQYKWQETRGVEEEGLLRNLPKDLRRDIKRHLCWDLLMRVPMFEKMDDQLLDAMCDHLKPVLYTEKSFIVREGDPVEEMLFVMRGNLVSTTTYGGRTGFFNAVYLKAGDFCGEALLTWALDPQSSSNRPLSTRTVQALTEVEAFSLMADDLKSVASQFRRLHSKQLQHAFRQVFFEFIA
ncbi:hypothetical protein CUMW_091360 [Citrus unshiu]|nr:hypothetical protein CUMW_091360 [Citrus unshiu]